MSEPSLVLLEREFAVCRLPCRDPLPSWSDNAAFSSVTRSADELSIVCLARDVPPEVRAERGWRALKIDAELEFSEIGIMARLAGALAAAGVGIFAVSTFTTDYLLIKQDALERARRALEANGWLIRSKG